MSNVIEVRGLKKYFGDVKAVDDVSFRVKRGELFAFLGLNGAGKSTTISILCSQLRKDAGEVIVDGADVDRQPDQVKRKIGVVFQNSCLDQLLTVRDNLKTRAALYGVTGPAFTARLGELTELLHLEELLRRPLGKLSGGQRRRIDVARAMLHQPEILILDEPTTGLDPQTRRMVWDVIARLRREQGLTVFLTTHYMEEAAEADYVVILDSGHVAAEGTPYDLKNAYTGDYIKLYKTEPAQLEGLGLAYEAQNGYLRMAVPHTADAKALILRHPGLFQDFEVVKGKMDDVFLAATGKELKEEAHA
ncbi:MAG: ABC transporter ATP-binding protein [Clostridiales bacterium]|nr:ABC transporter ATP-binding protein [Clostridiales bacterium]